jgi:shikimate dehydrogenase
MFKSLPLGADDLLGYSCVVDLVYSRTETPLVEAALARSIPVLDGLEILVGQGALSFERFTGRPAPVEVMRAAARAR